MTTHDLAALIAARVPGHSLPQPFYTADEIFAADLQTFFLRRWLNVGHVAQLPRPGAYFTFEIGAESVLVSRGADEKIHAHFNICRHRGSRICTAPCGQVGKLVCPYHQWVYDHDGRLLATRAMPADFDRAQYGLDRIPLRELEGFLFVCLAPAGETLPDFDAIVRDVGPFLRPHGLAQAQIAATQTYAVAANWKLVIENSRECDHCPVGHPEYSRAMLPDGAARRGQAERYAERQAHYAACGLPTAKRHGDGYFVSRYPLGRAGYVTESLDGRPVAPRMVAAAHDHDAGVCGAILHPNFMLEAVSDYTVRFLFTPVHATLTRVRADWFVHRDAVVGRDFEIDRVTAFWEATGGQDWKLCADNQAGVNSSHYRPGPYATGETGVEAFVEWYLAALRAAG